MTAPAVVRRWSEPGPSPVPGRAAPPAVAPGVAVPSGAAGVRLLRSVARDRLAGIRRVAPLGAVFLSVLVLQAGVAPHVAARQAAPDVLLVGVVAVAVGHGSRAGAGFGFAAGLGADLFLATPLGTSALAFTVVGHIFGQQSRVPRAGTAAALCGPASACFACRTGRRHGPEPARLRRRAAGRRASCPRAIVLTGFGVSAGRLATALVATALAGVPFPGLRGILEIAAVAAVSAPLGLAAFAGVGRLPAGTGSGGGR